MREVHYVDLTADPKIDRENPPDLAKWVPEAAPATPSSAGAASTSPPAQASATKADVPVKQLPAGKKADSSNKGSSKVNSEVAIAMRHRELADVSARSEQVLQKV